MSSQHTTQQTGWPRASRDRARQEAPPRSSRTSFPQWGELSTAEGQASATASENDGLSTAKFALLVVGLAAGLTLYIGHVHATKQVRAELQEVRTQNRTLHQQLDRLRSAYDRRTAPSVIYERARELGLREVPSYGSPIQMKARQTDAPGGNRTTR